MLLKKLLWIIKVVAILLGAGTQAHPVNSLEKPDSRISISFMESNTPILNNNEGFCAKPKLDNDKKVEADDPFNCAPEQSAWTLAHLQGLKAIQDMIKRKDVPALLYLKGMIEGRMPRKDIQKNRK